MPNERRMIVLDYETVREAFDEEFRETMQLIRSGETHLDNLAEGFTEADRVLWQMPKVDAVVVVRCKDCKTVIGFGDRTVQPDEVGICKMTQMCVSADDFCSYGKKRT